MVFQTENIIPSGGQINMIETIIDIFLLPWTLLGWLLKWFFSAAIWVTVIGGLWYFISSSKWSIRNPFVRKTVWDEDDFTGV